MTSFFPTALRFLALLVLHAPALAGPLQDHPGHWLGDLDTAKGGTIRLGAELFTRADGSAWASVSSPDQDAFDIPVSRIAGKGDTIELELPMGALALTWANGHFQGVWKQGKDALPFMLRKVEDFPKKTRPQTPGPPFPYRNETLAIPTVPGVTLGATLSMPAGVTRPNVVILVGGSGPGTRDGHNAGHQSFAVLADYLARRGIAVLRYDKRGVSRSTGRYAGHTVADLIDDLDGVVRMLRTRKAFKRLGLIGHSEGAQVAAAVAARRPGASDFVVSLAGVGLNGLDAMLVQDRVWALDHGATPAEADEAMVYVRRFYDIVLAEAEPERRLAALKALHEALAPTQQALIRKLSLNEGTLSLAWAKQPFLRATLQSDPSADWRAVRCPVLALNGSLDHQVPAPENLGGINAALKAGGNRKVESDILPGLNHGFQTASTGREDEYARIEETLAPVLLERVTEFVRRQR